MKLKPENEEINILKDNGRVGSSSGDQKNTQLGSHLYSSCVKKVQIGHSLHSARRLSLDLVIPSFLFSHAARFRDLEASSSGATDRPARLQTHHNLMGKL